MLAAGIVGPVHAAGVTKPGAGAPAGDAAGAGSGGDAQRSADERGGDARGPADERGGDARGPADERGGDARGAAGRRAALLSLQADASVQVPNDVMSVTLGSARSGPEPGPLNERVMGELQAVVTRARAVPSLKARLGQVATHPETDDRGRRNGNWQVSGSVIVEGSDLPALSKFAAAQAGTMQIQSVDFRLGDAARDQARQQTADRAIAAFRERAARMTKAFGRPGFRLHEVQVTDDEQPVGQPRPTPYGGSMMRSASTVDSVPAAAGETVVRSVVQGSIELREDTDGPSR